MPGPTFRSRFYFIRCGLNNTTTRLCKETHFDWISAYRWCVVIDGRCEWNLGKRRKKNLAAGGELDFRTFSPVFSSTNCHVGEDPSSTTFFARPGTCVDHHFFSHSTSSLFLRWVSCEYLSLNVAMMATQVNSSTLLCFMDFHISLFHL